MKKLPFLLSTLIIGLVGTQIFSAKTQALTIDSKGRSWWTVEELLEYKSVVDEEEKSLCNFNIDCLVAYRKSKLVEEKFATLSFLQAIQLIPTELDFKAKTIKILLFDENMNARGFSEEPQMGVTANDLVIWLEDSNFESHSGGNRIRRILNHEIPGHYPIFGFTNESPIKLETDREIEYPMTVNLEELKDRKLYNLKFDIEANYFASALTTSFRSCSTAKDFPNGKCVLSVASKKLQYDFIKADEELPPENHEDEIEPIEEPTPTPVTPPAPVAPEPTPKNPVQEGNALPLKNNLVAPKAPNTGVSMSPCITKTIEFPWWLVVVIAIGDGVVFWLFWPKNRKKVLTKNEKCDKMGTV